MLSYVKVGRSMEVVITEWALQSYIDLKAKGIFTDTDYKNILRPDAELLKTNNPFDTNHPKFGNTKFWGPATLNGVVIKYGHKMKWHNLGPGTIQLRLSVVIVETRLDDKSEKRAFMCTSYVKHDKSDKREMAKLKIKIQKIADGTFIYRGNL
jgi:hypothetical protein